MLFTYLILKLALGGVMEEVNRIASEQDMKERMKILKNELARLRMNYEQGTIDKKTYQAAEARILEGMQKLGRTGIPDEGRKGNIDLRRE